MNFRTVDLRDVPPPAAFADRQRVVDGAEASVLHGHGDLRSRRVELIFSPEKKSRRGNGGVNRERGQHDVLASSVMSTASQSGGVRHTKRPDRFTEFATVLLLALAVAGVVAGVLGYLVASGNLPPGVVGLEGLAPMGATNSYVLIATSTLITAFATVAMGRIT